MNYQIIKFNSENLNEVKFATKKAALILNSGGIVVHPTDTCYGIAADIRKKEAIERVYKFKNRKINKPLFIIVNSYSEFSVYGVWHSVIEEMIKKNPDKMYTFVVKRKNKLPLYINPNITTIGIQIPKTKISLALIKANGSPLIGTSANISGQENNYSVNEFIKQITGWNFTPDLILDGGELVRKNPSSVINVEKGKVRVLR